MHQPARSPRTRTGFTLLEILVALVLIGLLAGALVPSVLNQLSKGEIGRIVEDVVAVDNAAKAFRIDVKRWPGDVEDLFARPELSGSPTDAPLSGSYTAPLVGAWDGPYLERGTLGAAGLPTATGGTISNTLAGTGNRLQVSVTGLDLEQIRGVNAVIDGPSETSRWNAGQVRWDSAAAVPTLVYHGATLH
jgi:general secretion pathway protein G